MISLNLQLIRVIYQIIFMINEVIKPFGENVWELDLKLPYLSIKTEVYEMPKMFRKKTEVTVLITEVKLDKVVFMIMCVLDVAFRRHFTLIW